MYIDYNHQYFLLITQMMMDIHEYIHDKQPVNVQSCLCVVCSKSSHSLYIT